MPLFSIVIPTFNRVAMLREALASINAQTFRDFEAIVVDDGSDEDIVSATHVCAFPVQYLRQTNSGPGAARNLGLRNAHGEYITFLDSDDTWFPWTLEIFRRAIEDYGSPAFLAGFGALPDEKWETAADVGGQMDAQCYPDMLTACTDRTPPVGGTPSVCVRRNVLERAGGFATERINGEDTDLWLRLGACTGFVRILNPPVFRQRYHNRSVTRQLEPAVAGAHYLMRQEKNQMYPGGADRSRRRRRIICGTVRSVSRECLDQGKTDKAFRLYWESFWWNLGLGNIKYLAGFPVAACRRSDRQN